MRFIVGGYHAKQRLDTTKSSLELSQKGIRLDQLIRDNHINIKIFTDLEFCIAKVLDISLQTIWPSRYDKD